MEADAHRREVEDWRRGRYARLREPMSWLTLVGLEWLREGENRVGTAPDLELRLTSGPPLAGRLVRSGSAVTAHGATGGLTLGDAPVDGMRLVSDVDASPEKPPTILELGSLRMVLVRRGERLGLRVWDTASTALTEFDGIPHYPVDLAWRLLGRVEPPSPGETVAMPDVLGEIEEEPLAVTVTFQIDGVTYRIKAIDGGAGQLWLVFGDATNGATTYGAGRFVYTEPPNADGTVIVDFNRAYNPPCVFSPYATCPLPPPENRLSVRIEAGERSLAHR